jgi:hypothetical protein
MRLARAALVALALLAAAWFALGARQADDTDAAAAIVTGPGPLTPAAQTRARSLLHAAGWLNPDTSVAILRGRLLMREGHYRAALPVLEHVVAQEPENLDGWVYVAQAGLKVDRAEADVAVAHIARLYRQFR